MIFCRVFTRTAEAPRLCCLGYGWGKKKKKASTRAGEPLSFMMRFSRGCLCDRDGGVKNGNRTKSWKPLEEMATQSPIWILIIDKKQYQKQSLAPRPCPLGQNRVWVWPINVLDGCSYRTLHWWKSVLVSGDLGSPVSGFHLRLRHMILDTAPVTLQFFPHWAFTPTHALS